MGRMSNAHRRTAKDLEAQHISSTYARRNATVLFGMCSDCGCRVDLGAPHEPDCGTPDGSAPPPIDSARTWRSCACGQDVFGEKGAECVTCRALDRLVRTASRSVAT